MNTMKKPTLYNLTPARGQALLNFQGRIFPNTQMELFETDLIEEVRQTKERNKKSDLQNQLNSDFRNLLVQGDCLSACAYLKSKDIKVDLVYIDPPFASGANYAKKIYLRNNSLETFDDDNSIAEEIMYGDIWQKEDYLNWLYERLLAIRDVMGETASIYVHLDWHIGHYVKVLLDEVFGESNFINEIVWKRRTGVLAQSRQYGVATDSILFYSKSDSYLFHPPYFKEGTEDYVIERFKYTDENGRKYRLSPIVSPSYSPNLIYEYKGYKPPRNGWACSFETMKRWDKEGKLVFPKDKKQRIQRKQYLDEWEGNPLQNLWDFIPPVNPQASERLDYPTQKPVALLKKIIEVSTDNGMVVADFFSGSGTTAEAAYILDRKFVLSDIGINAVQTTRDRLVKAGSEFDILKVKDGIRLFRNPTQTTAKIFSLIDGFKTRTELGLGDFWDGGIIDDKGEFIPVKFVQLHDKLTKELLDVLLEEIYQLQDVTGALSKAKVIYAHVDPEINQSYLNKTIKDAGKTTVEVQLVSLEELLGEKADKLFMPDNADVIVKETEDGRTVEIKRFFSPYLKAKVDEYNSKKVKSIQKSFGDETEKGQPSQVKVSISENGLELIEAVQFDTTLRRDGVWKSNIDLEDKAGVKDKIKALYKIPAKVFKMKIRNIAGDEIILDSKDIQKQYKDIL